MGDVAVWSCVVLYGKGSVRPGIVWTGIVQCCFGNARYCSAMMVSWQSIERLGSVMVTYLYVSLRAVMVK